MSIRTTSTRSRTRALGASIGAAALAGGLLVAPTAAWAQGEDPAVETCSITDAQLNWGVKESFRTYISGSIANGEWITDDGVDYEYPFFTWTSSEGEVSSALDEGAVPFIGGVHFTGHDGLLQFDLADPAIEFEDAETAYLLLDMGATDSGATEELVSERVRVAKLDIAGAVESGSEGFSIVEATPRLTSDGAAAFNGDYGSYVAGEELDLMTLTATVEGCTLGEAAVTAPEDPEPEAPVAEEPAQQEIPWIPIAIGAVALLIIGVTGGMLIAGRSKNKQTADDASDDGGSTEA